MFGRDGDDLTVTVPVSFVELALGTTLSVPTLDGKVGVRVPKGTADGRILRVRGRGVPKRDGSNGDLLVTVKVAVPPNLEGAAAGGAGEVRGRGEGRAGSTQGPDGRGAMSACRQTVRRRDPHVLLISVAAQLAGMHAQTLRTYDRLGLVTPRRTTGGGRRYSQRDVDLLREVQRLSQDEGVNLAGIKRIIELTNQVEALQSRLRRADRGGPATAHQPAPRRRGGAEVHRAGGLGAAAVAALAAMSARAKSRTRS